MATLIEKLKSGNIPDYIEKIATIEEIDTSLLVENIIAGYVVVPRNNLRTNFDSIAIGKNTSVKVNANIGSSPARCDIDHEFEKAKISVESGADAIMDLSLSGDIWELRRRIIDELNVVIGTVPIYDSFAYLDGPEDLSFDKFMKDMEKQAKAKIDFMTIHSGLRRNHIPLIEKRNLGVVSRGGSAIVKWMRHHKKESFLYEYFDEILALAKEYDIVISLGDGLRPGCTADANDEAQFAELESIGELTQRCREADVQVMIEGPGHVPLHLIEENIKKEKEICANAPFYVLGPLVIDYGAGYDHITGAIGGALAAFFGADFLCYVTPAEHLRLPSIDDVKEGVIASKIAASAADLSRKSRKEIDRNYKISIARKEFDWKTQEELSIDKEKFSNYLEKATDRSPDDNDDIPCSMCAEWCAMKKDD